MALQLSDALRNSLLQHVSFAQAFMGGTLAIYSGSQPANANAAPVGTLLATVTVGSAAHTDEVAAIGSVSLDSGGSGSVNTLTVNNIELLGGAVAFNTSLALTATDVVTAINKNAKSPVTAANGGTATITLTAKPGFGAVTWTVSSTVTTIGKTDNNMAAGTNSANGLKFGVSTTGTLVKDPAQTWSGLGLADGTAGYFRLKAAVADAGALDSSAVYKRLDGSIGTSGANLNLSTTAIATGATLTITSFSPTEPAA